MAKTNFVDLGLTDYRSAWDLQRRLFDLRLSGRIPDVVLLNEHNHVYTLGRTADPDHLLADDEELKRRGVEVCRIDRGGDVTYHGPGQLVVYPIISLNPDRCDVHRYLRDLEEVVIRTLAGYQIAAVRDRDFTGVWAGNSKICAIGVRVSHWITMHGFALNVNTDLSYFDRIIPCGIFHRGVTSLQRLTEREIPLGEVAERIIDNFAEVFGAEPVVETAGELSEAVARLKIEEPACLR
ncbi:MAG: lipoyl(octanoyl) transferase LipB [Ignavibacteria bacterium]|nr:MAG: lipoyl(octanoyl) transferase LipB [Ignavibacteria bacterium]